MRNGTILDTLLTTDCSEIEVRSSEGKNPYRLRVSNKLADDDVFALINLEELRRLHRRLGAFIEKVDADALVPPMSTKSGDEDEETVEVEVPVNTTASSDLKTTTDNELESRLREAEAAVRELRNEKAKRNKAALAKLEGYLVEKEIEFASKLSNTKKLRMRISQGDGFATFDGTEIDYFIATGNWSK